MYDILLSGILYWIICNPFTYVFIIFLCIYYKNDVLIWLWLMQGRNTKTLVVLWCIDKNIRNYWINYINEKSDKKALNMWSARWLIIIERHIISFNEWHQVWRTNVQNNCLFLPFWNKQACIYMCICILL